ncbi:MAG: hypothetical protein HDT44_04625 [Ruminococcaceae bacterium]|nr:hypothetical protein [Oscillospiraceae bacterium]
MKKFAVIDTETTWGDEVMSIGAAVADFEGDKPFALADKKYYILTPYKDHGGMYTHTLYVNGIKPDFEGSRAQTMKKLREFFTEQKVSLIFAYNALFDYHHLPELKDFQWYDIMKLAAYKQYNKKIPDTADCFNTGRMKRGYGVEDIYRMLSGDSSYHELHNALTDSVDELAIMRMLGLGFDTYKAARID